MLAIADEVIERPRGLLHLLTAGFGTIRTLRNVRSGIEVQPQFMHFLLLS
jgi:hypothetical protein